jgi:CRISPR-associated protein Cas6
MGPSAAGMGRDSSTGGNKIGWLTDNDGTSELEHAAVTDVQFELKGRALPKDHGYALFLELARLLPWIADEETLGIHPVHGADTGQGELVLSRRTRLVIRTPIGRVEDIMQLSGKIMHIAGETLAIGAGKTRPLTLHTPLYAHCVTTGSDDEAAFAADIIRLLDEMHIDSRFICGRRQSINTAAGVVSGYSLMLHGLPVEHAVQIQVSGLGGNRKLGCGIFIPHKSINALT